MVLVCRDLEGIDRIQSNTKNQRQKSHRYIIIMSAIPVSLNRERSIQVDQIRMSRPDCKNLTVDEVVKKLLFEKVDEEIKRVVK